MAKRFKKKKRPPEVRSGQVTGTEARTFTPGATSGSVVSSKQKIGSKFLKQPWWQRDELRALLLILAVVLAYQPVWYAGTIWDDDAHMIGLELRSGYGLERIWFQPGATQQYYPVVYTVFWLEQHIWGAAPLGYHLVNVVLHITSALLVVKVLRRLEVPGAWLGAALWALHPVQVESVAWISELKNTLSGVCYFGSTLVYLRFDRERKWKFYGVAFGLFVVGLLAKTVIATLPAALLLIFWWKRKKLRWGKDVLPLGPFFIVGVSLGLFTAWVERTYVIGRVTTDFNFSLIERFLIAGRDIWFYLGKLVWPHPLIFIYPRWEVSGAIWWEYLFPAAALLLGAGLWRWRRLLGDGPLVTLLFFAGTLFPALGFFDVFPFRYSFVADHFQYLASMGPLALAGAGLTKFWNEVIPRKPWLQSVACGGLLIILGTMTWQRAWVFENIETLWADTLERNPNCWLAYNNLGSFLLKKGEVKEATEQYEKGLRIKPDSALGHSNLGGVLQITGHLPEAIDQYEQAVQFDPDDAVTRYDFGNLLLKTGRLSEAMEQIQQALRIDPDNSDAHNIMGLALFQAGNVPEATEQFEVAVKEKPDNAEAHNNLGLVMLQTGRVPEAIEHFEEAGRIKPDYAEAYFDLANALYQEGRPADAIQQYEQALQIKPDYAEAHNNLGSALFLTGQVSEAIEQYEQALQIKPEYVDAHVNLGRLLQKTGRTPEAIEQYEEALRLNPGLTVARDALAKLEALQKANPAKN